MKEEVPTFEILPWGWHQLTPIDFDSHTYLGTFVLSILMCLVLITFFCLFSSFSLYNYSSRFVFTSLSLFLAVYLFLYNYPSRFVFTCLFLSLSTFRSIFCSAFLFYFSMFFTSTSFFLSSYTYLSQTHPFFHLPRYCLTCMAANLSIHVYSFWVFWYPCLYLFFISL